MLRKGAVAILMLFTLSACGHTPEERLVSGALIGGAIGAVVGLSAEPGYGGHHRSDRHYKRSRGHRRHHDDGGWRRRGYDDYYDRY